MFKAMGITLLELLTVLLMLSISLAAAVPSLTYSNENSLRRAQMGVLIRSLHLARTTAIASRRTTTFCASRDRINCDGHWHEGTILFKDANNNHRRDEDETILDTAYKFDGNATLHWQASGRRNAFIRFSPQGEAKEFGTFTYCPASGNLRHAGLLVINRQGRIHIGRDRNGDGIVEKPDGSSATC